MCHLPALQWLANLPWKVEGRVCKVFFQSHSNFKTWLTSKSNKSLLKWLLVFWFSSSLLSKIGFTLFFLIAADHNNRMRTLFWVISHLSWPKGRREKERVLHHLLRHPPIFRQWNMKLAAKSRGIFIHPDNGVYCWANHLLFQKKNNWACV